jgi:hypothetical protein
MTQTFTSASDFTAEQPQKELKNTFLASAEPSENTIQNILNFSKNLEIKQSKLVNFIELIRS